MRSFAREQAAQEFGVLGHLVSSGGGDERRACGPQTLGEGRVLSFERRVSAAAAASMAEHNNWPARPGSTASFVCRKSDQTAIPAFHRHCSRAGPMPDAS